MSNNQEALTKLFQDVKSSQVLQQLKVPHDALIAILHFMLLSEGFECTGLESDSQSVVQQLPSNWNKSKDVYAFKYIHALAPNKTFLLKCLTLGKQILVHATVLEQSSNVCSCDCNTSEYLKESVVQQFIQGSSNSDSQSFASFFNNVDKLFNTVKTNITRKLVPQIAQQEQQQQQSSNKLPSTVTIPQQPQKSPQVQQPPPQQPQQPQYYPQQPQRNFYEDDFDNDPLRIGRPMRGRGNVGGFNDPLGFGGIGGNDLMPNLPPPTFGGMGGYRSGGFGNPNSGGNLVGPHHPGFGVPPSFGNLPSGVPQGARFDPYGPPNPYGSGRGRGVPPQAQPPPQSNPNQFKPDPDHEKPPGNENDNPYFM